ncbi:MAG: hypothetical protein IPM39_29505 [Chloroflexi bacterium]|nr:hypothetical protein [Chloroflexota bacterium]
MSSYEQTVEFSLPDNPGASLTFMPQDSILINAAGEIVPRTARTATTDDETGAGSIDLPVPDDTGRRVWRWTVVLPDEETGQFELGRHTGVAQLSVLLTLGMTPQPASPGSLAALIAAYSLPQAQVDWLDDLPVVKGYLMQRTAVPAGETVTIPANHQMVVVGDFTVDGELIAVGDLVILD